MHGEQQLLNKLYTAQNCINEEQNYIEILKVYCENRMENSSEVNKIYPILLIIEQSHRNISDKINEIISII